MQGAAAGLGTTIARAPGLDRLKCAMDTRRPPSKLQCRGRVPDLLPKVRLTEVEGRSQMKDKWKMRKARDQREHLLHQAYQEGQNCIGVGFVQRANEGEAIELFDMSSESHLENIAHSYVEGSQFLEVMLKSHWRPSTMVRRLKLTPSRRD